MTRKSRGGGRRRKVRVGQDEGDASTGRGPLLVSGQLDPQPSSPRHRTCRSPPAQQQASSPPPASSPRSPLFSARCSLRRSSSSGRPIRPGPRLRPGGAVRTTSPRRSRVSTRRSTLRPWVAASIRGKEDATWLTSAPRDRTDGARGPDLRPPSTSATILVLIER